MEEVINILGSPSPWLMWVNLAVIGVLCWVIERLASKIKRMEKNISHMDRGIARQSQAITQIVRKVYGTEGQVVN